MTLDIITSGHLGGLRHGFFGRSGGASSGVFAGLNCGPGSSDQHEAVRINRGRAAEALGLPPEHLAGLAQVHSADVVTIEAVPAQPPRADGLVTRVPGLAISVLSADCQPVLMADAEAGVIGAAHAGWKGALAGVLEATIAAMEAQGARRDRIAAVIGPTISRAAYEVGPEMQAAVTADAPEAARFFAPGKGDRLHFDLPGYGLWRLRRAGIGAADWTGHCTYADPARFFSYRRSTHAREADYGRLIAAIRL
ncbi:peptidoglycan editing factor PgeF [Pseudoroseicyclus aestuarii]|uniref:Purine nucleoside phosphorylase n=1 Tax=Pseudoroseicyclus aestuarii TaxID=1795041 RepID=A0A318SR38_9RHOB|nr:peptidoglycan editing factor PgeF [Pseudoroseicyclus aestuarii]PYE84052.1 hypothetical protein DFP88_103416 [Pseudoroseicyclus aestuarii]